MGENLCWRVLRYSSRLLSLGEGVSPGTHRGEGDRPQSGLIPFSLPVTTQGEVSLMKDSILALFCRLDAFAQLYNDGQQHHWIPSEGQRQMAGKLCLGQMLSITPQSPSTPTTIHSSGIPCTTNTTSDPMACNKHPKVLTAFPPSLRQSPPPLGSVVMNHCPFLC